METASPRQDCGTDSPAAGEGSSSGASAAEAKARREALVSSFWLARDVQTGEGAASAAIERLIAEAERREWPDVILGGLYATCVLARESGEEGLLDEIERLRERAEAEADTAMTALALALRARARSQSRDSTQSVAADGDLARATVMLESADGGALQRASAHNSCAIVYGQRRLWELEDQQYAAAERLLPDCADSPMPSTVLYNRAELQLDWACAMREIGDADAVAKHCLAGAAASIAANEVVWRPSWRREMAVNDVLLAAVGGADVADAARFLLVDETYGLESSAGYLHLAIALSPGSPEIVAAAAELAIETIDPGLGPTEYDLALRVAAGLEAAAGNGRSAGLRCAEHQIELRWGNRLSALAAMESLLQGERLRTEHDRLSRHAHLDDLTGLANRRGLQRYLTGLEQRDGRQMTILVLDIDGFKKVNDRHGHRAGDDTLVLVASILSAHIRSGDLAVRLGGDEFALILPDTDPSVATRRASAIVFAMTNARPWHNTAEGLAVTVSVGLAGGPPEEIVEVMARADAAMYQAKAAGGSRVVSS